MSDIMSLAAIGYPAPLFSSLRDHYAGNLLHTLSISGLSRAHKFSLQDGMMTQEKAVWHAIRAGQRLADDYAPGTENKMRYSCVMERDTESLKNELEAIAHWDRGLIFQDSISALDHLSYELRKERKFGIEAELRKRNEI